MSILKSLFASSLPGAAPASGDTETVRRIVRKLEEMEPVRARYVAAFAYVLARVAQADLTVSDEETRKMEEIVMEVGGLPEEQAVLVVGIAKSQGRLSGGTENFLVTREFKEIAPAEDRMRLLDCLFAVSAADDSISTAEETTIRQIASELDLSHAEYIAARSRWSDKREILKRFRRSE